MTKRALLLLVVSVVFLAGAIASTARLTVAWRHEVVTQLVWTSDRAFLYVNEAHRVWSGSYTAWGWQLLRSVLGGSTQGIVTTTRTTVLAIDETGVTTFDTQQGSMPLTVFENAVYTRVGGVLQRWDGSTFHPVDAGDERRYSAAAINSEPRYTNVSGWSGAMSLLMDGRREYLIGSHQRIRIVAMRNMAEAEKVLEVHIGSSLAWRGVWRDEATYVTGAR